MVAFAQNGCFLGNAVVFGKKLLYSCNVVVLMQKWLYSGKKCCIRAKLVVLGQKWLYSGKSGYNREKLLYSGKRGCISK